MSLAKVVFMINKYIFLLGKSLLKSGKSFYLSKNWFFNTFNTSHSSRPVYPTGGSAAPLSGVLAVPNTGRTIGLMTQIVPGEEQ